jgi:alpha-amylase
VLSQVGNPYPAGDAYNVYVARRAGNGTKSGAIVVINNHDSSTKGLWVDSAPSGWASLAGQTLVNAFNAAETTVVQADGRVWVQAPARGYAVYVKQSEYVAYVDPGAREDVEEANAGEEIKNEVELKVWSNPVRGNKLSVMVASPRTEKVQLEFLTLKGDHIIRQSTMTNESTDIDIANCAKGMYILRASAGSFVRAEKVIKE